MSYGSTMLSDDNCQSDDEDQTNYDVTSAHELEYLFEPIFKFDERICSIAGHKAIVAPADDKRHPYFECINTDPSTVSLLQVLESGESQEHLVQRHVESFLKWKQKSLDQKLVFELCPADLVNDPNKIVVIGNNLKWAEKKGIDLSDIVIEVPCTVFVDRGIIYTIAQALREFGVMIALTDMDADAFSFARVFELKPDIVKFNRSWLNFDLESTSYLMFMRSILRPIHRAGLYTNLGGIKNWNELEFASKCEFTRCQGDFFGKPTTEIRGDIRYQIVDRLVYEAKEAA